MLVENQQSARAICPMRAGLPWKIQADISLIHIAEEKSLKRRLIYAAVVLPRAGLANQLFVWARAAKFCLGHDTRLLNPVFTKPHIGPILRGEKDFRFYIGLFRTVGAREISGLKKLWVKLVSRRMSKEHWDSISPDSSSVRPRLVVFRRTTENFNEINGCHRELGIWLHEMTHPRWLESYSEVGEILVGMHVRLGDFSGSIRHPISWYVDAVQFVHSIAGVVPVSVFSDGSDSELIELLSLPGVTVVRTGSAISDLLALSRSQFLIGTGTSTFSAWAAFLGQMPAFTRLGNSFSSFGLENTENKFVGEWDPRSPDAHLLVELSRLENSGL